MESELLGFYAAGNEHFRGTRYDDAIASYTEAIAASSALDFPAIGRESQLTILKSFLNRAFCHFKQRNYSLAIQDNTSVLKLLELMRGAVDAKEASTLEQKALLRRSAAHEYSCDFRSASLDLRTLRERYPSLFASSEAVQQAVRRVSSLLSLDEKKAHEEGNNSTMIHIAQSLRLLFLSEMPSRVALSHSAAINGDGAAWTSNIVSCRLCLGNELGLFNRSLYISSESDSLGFLRCSVVPLNDSSLSSCVSLCSVGGEDPTDRDSWSIPSNGKLTVDFRLKMNATNETNTKKIFLLQFSVKDFIKGDVQVLPICSVPITLFCDGQSSINEDSHFDRAIQSMEISCIRPVVFKPFAEDEHSAEDKVIFAFESPGLLGIAGKVWDSSFVLVSFLRHHRSELIDGKHVVELGSGTGVTGLAIAGMRPLSVTLTDLAPVVPLIQANIDLNKSARADDRSCGDISATPFEWGSSLRDGETTTERANIFSNCDTIVASDVVYYPEGYEPLVNSIVQCLTLDDHERCFIFAHRHRHPQDQEFFDLIAAHKEISLTEINWKNDLQFENDNGQRSFSDVRLFKVEKNILK